MVTVSVVAARHDTSTVVAASEPASVAIAKPPLLEILPQVTPPIRLASGGRGATKWTLYVKMSPLAGPARFTGEVGGVAVASFVNGLAFDVRTPLGDGGGGDDPRLQAALTWQTFGPERNFPTELVFGATSARATNVVLSFGGSPASVTAPTLTTPKLPGLRFYVAVAPAAGADQRVEAVARAADGAPLLRSDPNLPPPPPDEHP